MLIPDVSDCVQSVTTVVLQAAGEVDLHEITAYFKGDETFVFVETSGTFDDVFSHCKRYSRCVLVAERSWMDLTDARQKTDLLRHAHNIRVIVCVEEADTLNVEDFVLTGCWGLIQAKMPVAQLGRAIKVIANDEMWVPRKILSRMVRQFLSSDIPRKLSRRETQILGLVADVRTNKDIADRLFISEETLRWHLRNIYSKTGISGRSEMVLYAREQLNDSSSGDRSN